ncbi:amidohydrolase family protein [Ponticaulis sp.]|uniref:amidohydrolase family protein n=1 Tax=Ponticaulis sp. TaxID=2020902 RepID=UPI002627CF2A|nr:amidohydrolase family protein [Ponticaulis sp.]MDF1679046.1 amidohydrolase family protein [Ponticaulis sp.]
MMNAPLHVDTLIRNGTILTMDEGRRVFTDGFIAIKDGSILAVGEDRLCEFTADEVISAEGQMVMPGFANAHNHLVQSCFRGYNDDRWPVLDIPAAVRALIQQLFLMAGAMDEERTYKIVRLHALEMLKLGYTATHDEHFTNVRKDSVDGSWRAIEESGMRGYLCRCIANSKSVPEEGHERSDAGLLEIERLGAKFNSDRISVAGGFLNFNFLADPEDMRRIRQGCDQLGVAFGIDMTDNSRGAALKARGFEGGQVEYYRSFDLLEEPIYAGKAVNVQPHEFDILKEHDCRVSPVPVLRFFDATGISVDEFLKRDMLPAIGTDAPLVSDSQNPFEVMRLMILAQNVNVKARVAAGGERPAREHWLTAEKCLEMATLGGARTLFMEDKCGSLEVGKAADLVMVDMRKVEAQPGYDGRRGPGALVWGGQTSMVDTVFVAGRKLVDGGRSTLWDEELVVAEANDVLREIAEETGLYDYLPNRTAGSEFRGWSYI